ncbi:MAG: hypothetical protein KGL39_26855 [Patescibacteria group bacterium]|nr:hypothetical protein [Patescibacteria group bacterium]
MTAQDFVQLVEHYLSRPPAGSSAMESARLGVIITRFKFEFPVMRWEEVLEALGIKNSAGGLPQLVQTLQNRRARVLGPALVSQYREAALAQKELLQSMDNRTAHRVVYPDRVKKKIGRAG